MRIGIVNGLVFLLCSSGLAVAQSPPAPGTAPPAAPVVAAGYPLTCPHPEAAEEGAGHELIADGPSPGGRCYPDDGSCLKKLYPDGSVWFSAEYLLWWVRNQATPPLITTGPGSMPVLQFGALGGMDTRTLFGGDVGYGTNRGVRLMGGLQGPNHAVSLELSGFVLERRSAGKGFASDAQGDQVLARPLFDVVNNASSRALVAGPGAFAGAVTAITSSRLWGWEANVTGAGFGLLGCDSRVDVDLLAGFRYLDLDERLALNQTSALLPGSSTGFAGATISAPGIVGVADSFVTRNLFFGPQIGAEIEYQHCRFFFFSTAKLAMGVSHRISTINGLSTLGLPDGSFQQVPGGVLAVASNIGRRLHDDFAVVPEVTMNVGYQVNRNFRAYIGYNFLYWSEVARPGDQVDLNVNIGQVPTSTAFGQGGGGPPPASVLRRSDYWAQGLNVGLALHF